jgi:hypothetical protein
VHHPTAPAKLPKKFHIFHKRNVWKSSSVNKGCSPAEHSMIAASHPKQEPRVMRKAVRQPVNGRRGRQTDPKETATDFWIVHYAANLIQTFQRHFGVCMQKPENIAACGVRSGIHLFRTAALAAPDNLVTEALRQPIGAVGARAIDDDNFRPKSSLAQIREKRAYPRRFVKDGNNNRDLHRRFLSELLRLSDFLCSVTHQKTFLEIKWLLGPSLRRIEFNKSERKTHMIAKIIIAAAIALFFSPATALFSQEHPEHPEHPKAGGAQKKVSTADISAGIKKNITTETNKSDGKFHVKYEGQDLALNLIKVHDDRLQDLGSGKYFACVDMKGTDGKTYDIDFFLTGQPGKMKVTDTAVHKIDGKPLYNWKEENGKWNKVPTS